MRVSTSYRQIVQLSLPIILGSAAQNMIALSDSVFLYHLSEIDFAAIGFVSVFYLVVAAIGYGFSKGGQIVIARRAGERDFTAVGRTFYAMLYFELTLAVVMFAIMRWGTPVLFDWLVNSDAIYAKSLAYLEHRSWGVFFSYTGVAVIALYTGIARTWFILVDTLLLAVVNIVLNYTLIFGHFGMPAMGIAGAGLASSLAEVTAFIAFLMYIVIGDRKIRQYAIFRLPRIDMALIRNQVAISAPIVAQGVVGLGSWLIFFSIVETLGERELAVSNLVRMVYLMLSIPTWGFASGINTLVSNLIGQRRRDAVLPVTIRTASLSWLVTMVLALPVVLFPHTVLYPLFGGTDATLITEAQPILWILLLILSLFSVGGILYNGLTGTGATLYGLKIQTGSAISYLIYIYVVVHSCEAGLSWAWLSEAWYWVAMLLLSLRYLSSRRWRRLTV